MDEDKNKKDEVEEKKKSTDKMDEPHGAKPKVEIGFSALHKSRRVSDDVTGDTERGDTQRIDPMVDANGHLPYINFTQRDRSVSHGSIGFQGMNGGSVFVV